jgi:glucose-6-phosphate-specific signal transduction histidine kinase
MLMLEDKLLLDNNFANGLQMGLLRRYTALNRKILLDIDDTVENTLNKSNSEFKNNFYSIAMEISNNDLKYGFGDSYWKVDLFDSNTIQLEMKSNSKYADSKDTGKGQIGISHKVEKLGGNLHEEIVNKIYRIQINVRLLQYK